MDGTTWHFLRKEPMWWLLFWTVPIVLLLKKEQKTHIHHPGLCHQLIVFFQEAPKKEKKKQFSLLRLFQFIFLAFASALCVCLRFNEWNNSS
jgi:hypothetical protein